MVVQLVSMLMNAHSLEMMLSVTMPLVITLMDHLNVLASLATLVLHVLTTTNAKMVPIIVTKMHHVPTPTEALHALVIQASKAKVMSAPTSMSALLNMPIKTFADQTPIARIPLQDIFAHVQTASLVYQPIKTTAVKILTNATLTVTITATNGPHVPMKYHFTAVNVTSQVTTVMVSSASMLMNVMTLSVVTTAPMVPTVSAIILMAATIAHVLMVTTQPTKPTLFVLTSTNVLMEHTTATLMLLAPTLTVDSNVLVKKVSLVTDTTLNLKWVALISMNAQ